MENYFNAIAYMMVLYYLCYMIQLLLHLFGDYFLQNDWMAINKSKYSIVGWQACFIHCLLYAIPFGLYYHSHWIFYLVFITHFTIDKFTLAQYWSKLVNWNWDDTSVYGFSPDRPTFITVWLHIIRDNSIHIAGNYFIIQHFS